MSTAGDAAEPVDLVRVVRGEVSDDELAALVAGIVAAGQPDPEADPPTPTPAGVWTERGRLLGAAPTPGPHSWRWSARR